MSGSAVVVLITEWREWGRSTTTVEQEVNRRTVASWGYRCAADLLIWADLVIIFLVRFQPFHWLRTWLTQHPLTLFFILLAAMVLLTLNNIVDYLWNRSLIARLYRERSK